MDRNIATTVLKFKLKVIHIVYSLPPVALMAASRNKEGFG
jgi:hypothetical protein